MCELIMIIAGCINVAASYVQLLQFHAWPIARCLGTWLYTGAYEGRKMLTCITSKLTIYVHVRAERYCHLGITINTVTNIHDMNIFTIFYTV